jgi:hypothetical protein
VIEENTFGVVLGAAVAFAVVAFAVVAFAVVAFAVVAFAVVALPLVAFFAAKAADAHGVSGVCPHGVGGCEAVATKRP